MRDGFVTYFAFVVRDGSRVRFWLDTWCRYHTLKELYPEFSSIVVDKDLLVYSCLELAVGGGSSSWNVRFC